MSSEDDDAVGDASGMAGSAELANCSYKSDSDPFKKRMALSDFSMLKVLGKGSFGKVFHLVQVLPGLLYFAVCMVYAWHGIVGEAETLS